MKAAAAKCKGFELERSPRTGVEVALALRHARQRVFNADGLFNLGRCPNGWSGRERACQTAAKRTRHRPAVGLVLDVHVRRPDGILRMLVGRALPVVSLAIPRTHGHAARLVCCQIVVVVAALPQVPGAHQLRVLPTPQRTRTHVKLWRELSMRITAAYPVAEVRIVGLGVVRIVFGSRHAKRVHRTPESGLVAVLLIDRSQRRLIDLRLNINLGCGWHASVSPRRKRRRQARRVAADALLELVDEYHLVDGHRRSRRIHVRKNYGLIHVRKNYGLSRNGVRQEAHDVRQAQHGKGAADGTAAWSQGAEAKGPPSSRDGLLVEAQAPRASGPRGTCQV